MKTSLEHLPDHKREQLQRITETIVSVDPEKVILFGSHATGRWVEERSYKRNLIDEYISDYDILVITKSGEQRKDYEVESLIENRVRTKTPVNIIVHDIDFVNRMLAEEQYFFSDIKREGILLYDAGNTPLADPREMTAQEKSLLAEEDFRYWHGSSKGFLRHAVEDLKEKELKIGVFELHQATERIYNAVILVFTGYKPRTHNLDKLYRLSVTFSPSLADVFPRHTTEEKHLFNLLKKGYIDARYKKTYAITEEELSTLVDRVKQLQKIAEEICRERIERLGQGNEL